MKGCVRLPLRAERTQNDDNSRSLLHLVLQVHDYDRLLRGDVSRFGDLREGRTPHVRCHRRGRTETAGNADVDTWSGRETLGRVGFRSSSSRRVDIAQFPAAITRNWDASGVALMNRGFQVPTLS